MKIRCKGFTLIELLVSMLVVAIAMLGFAALQTFSSRSLSSTASKQSSSDALNAYVRFIESSRASIDTFNWPAANQVTLTCSNISGNAIFGTGDPAQAFQNTFDTLCDQYIRNRNDLLNIDFAVLLKRNNKVGGIDGLTVYGAQIALVYQPVPQGRTKKAMEDQYDVSKVENFSQGAFCPFSTLTDDQAAAMQKNRAKYNIVCNNVGVSL